ncbi:MAG: hypothetical protein CL534_12125 [Ahrensia sp.]|nr:hypothetical protein [Ahrensia sp.]
MFRSIDKATYEVFKSLVDYEEKTSKRTVRDHLYSASKKKSDPSGYSPAVTKAHWKIIDNIPDEKMTRDALSKYVNDASRTPLEIIFAILGWGGIGADNFRRFLERGTKPFEAVVSDIRKNKLERYDAYDRIKALKPGKKPADWLLYGISPAYYTKVIFFLTRESGRPGYIMDQFSGRSVNFLWNDEAVILNETGKVHSDNNAENYIFFCARVEALATKLSTRKTTRSGEEVEFALFNPNSHWRKYLTTHDKVAQRKAAKKAKAKGKKRGSSEDDGD